MRASISDLATLRRPSIRDSILVSNQLYFAILIALAAAGFLAGRWLLIPAVLALWAIGLAIAALAGAFHHTGEDSSAGVFYFSAFPTMLWVFAFTLGTIVRRIVRWIASRARDGRRERGTSVTG